MTVPSFIYLIEAENGLVKIGRAQKVGDRVHMVRLHSPLRTRLIATWLGADVDEAALHERFRVQRRHGEWFEPVGAFGEFVDRTRGLGVDVITPWDDLRFSERNSYRSRQAIFGKARGLKPQKIGKQCASRKTGLTRQQSRALEFILEFISEHGWSPSYQELANELGLASKSGIHRIIHGLVERGHLAVQAGKCRAIIVPSGPVPDLTDAASREVAA